MTRATAQGASWNPADPGRVLVYGLGLSGRAALELLAARGVSDVTAVDDREADAAGGEALAEARERARRVHLGGEVPETPPEGTDLVVVSPGVPPDRPLLAAARQAGVPIVSEVELAFPFLDGPLVGITGSNGKSTTTAWTGALFEASGARVEVCGNIGRPLAAVVARRVLGRDGDDGGETAHGGGRIWVVELSSYQLENLDRFRPRAAAYLNLAPDHLDRYPDLDAYDEAKRNLLRALPEEGTAVVNADDARTAEAPTAARRRLFSRRRRVPDGCWLSGDQVIETDPSGASAPLFARGDVALPGEHNLENAMAAALLARALGVSAEALRDGLAGFAGLAHRTQRVRELAGVTWYDDSKGTNPAATLSALEGFPDGSVHLVLGGRGKGLDFTEMRPRVEAKAKRVYLVGEAADEIEAALGGAVPVERCGTLERAVPAAARHAGGGEVVLLSPACASFDQFASYEERGRRFQELVRELPEPAPAGGGEG